MTTTTTDMPQLNLKASTNTRLAKFIHTRATREASEATSSWAFKAEAIPDGMGQGSNYAGAIYHEEASCRDPSRQCTRIPSKRPRLAVDD
ncbi:hypothetical protein PILCRDRAFT_826572, partial [Piloderma croceum F 1598]